MGVSVVVVVVVVVVNNVLSHEPFGPVDPSHAA